MQKQRSRAAPIIPSAFCARWQVLLWVFLCCLLAFDGDRKRTASNGALWLWHLFIFIATDECDSGVDRIAETEEIADVLFWISSRVESAVCVLADHVPMTARPQSEFKPNHVDESHFSRAVVSLKSWEFSMRFAALNAVHVETSPNHRWPIYRAIFGFVLLASRESGGISQSLRRGRSILQML